jgi:uncharacterized protein (DUF58 family)
MNVRRAIFLGLAGLVVAALLGSEALVFAMFAVVLFAGLVALTTRRVFDNLEYVHSISQRVVAWGGEIEIVTTVSNRKWLPLVWLRVRDDWPSSVSPIAFTLRPSSKQATRVLAQAFSVRWFQRVRRHYRARCLERGVYGFGPATMQAGDPLGLTEVTRGVDAVDRIVVLPKVLDVPELPLAIGRPLVAETARRSLIRDPANLVNVRRYRPGDPLKTINWRALARTGSLHTNEFEPSVTAEVRILLNMRVYQYGWQGIDPELMELLCVVAASAAAALTDQGFAVGLRSNGLIALARDPLDVDPAPGTLPEILDGLARIVVFPPPPFQRVLTSELQTAGRPAEYLLVTPTFTGGLADRVRELRETRSAHIIFVGDEPQEDASLVDWHIPRSFDWRTSDALPLA